MANETLENHRVEDKNAVLNLREAADYMRISTDTLYKYLADRENNRLPCFKLGNRWRFKRDLLDRWMETKSAV